MGKKGVAKSACRRQAVLSGAWSGKLLSWWPRDLVSGSWRSAAVMESGGSSPVFPVTFTHGGLAFLEGCERQRGLLDTPVETVLLWMEWGNVDVVQGCSQLPYALSPEATTWYEEETLGHVLMQYCRFGPRPGPGARTGSFMSNIRY